MVSRLMLNLHELANASQYSTTDDQSTDPNFRFQARTTGVELDTLRSGDMIPGTLLFPNSLETSSFAPRPSEQLSRGLV